MNFKIPTVILIVLLMLGCNTMRVETMTKEGKKITAEGSGAGRGAISLSVDPDGTTEAIGCFDATSDWLWLRILPTMVKGAIAAFFGKPVPLGSDIDGPSGIGGCDSLLTNE